MKRLISLIIGVILAITLFLSCSKQEKELVDNKTESTKIPTMAEPTPNYELPPEQMDLSFKGITNKQLADMLQNGEISADVTALELSFNAINDLGVFNGLVNLNYLGLMGNKIKDINALGDLTNLTDLYLAGNEINDISTLSNLTNLTTLYLSVNKISDISALCDLTNLVVLSIDDNLIIDDQKSDLIVALPNCEITFFEVE